jgi:hypothetical protein
VYILSTYGDELGDTTRHFILYGEFIFKWGERNKMFLPLRYEVDWNFLQTGTQFVRRFGAVYQFLEALPLNLPWGSSLTNVSRHKNL